jgi:hypothetical protein
MVCIAIANLLGSISRWSSVCLGISISSVGIIHPSLLQLRCDRMIACEAEPELSDAGCSPRPGVLSHLRQRRFRLGQPERHFPRPVQLDGGGQLGVGLSAASDLSIERPEAEVAVGLERAHAQLLGQGEGLAEVIAGLIALRRFAPRRNLAKKAQGICLVAAFLVCTGMH